MKTIISCAKQDSLLWLIERDHYITEEVLRKKLTDKEIIIAEAGKEKLGWLRFGYFWDCIPFMNMLCVEETHRRKGIGKQLVLYWEHEMEKRNHKHVLTSTQSNEEAQHFYRKLGYKEAGSLIFPGEALEIIFIKNLRTDN